MIKVRNNYQELGHVKFLEIAARDYKQLNNGHYNRKWQKISNDETEKYSYGYDSNIRMTKTTEMNLIGSGPVIRSYGQKNDHFLCPESIFKNNDQSQE